MLYPNKKNLLIYFQSLTKLVLKSEDSPLAIFAFFYYEPFSMKKIFSILCSLLIVTNSLVADSPLMPEDSLSYPDSELAACAGSACPPRNSNGVCGGNGGGCGSNYSACQPSGPCAPVCQPCDPGASACGTLCGVSRFSMGLAVLAVAAVGVLIVIVSKESSHVHSPN